MNVTIHNMRPRVSDRPAFIATAAQDAIPILAPPRRSRYEVAIRPLRQLPSVTDQEKALNDLAANGWEIVGVDDGVAYLQRKAID